MSKSSLILFNEKIWEQFPGFRPEISLHELPIWGNFTVRNIVDLSNIEEIPHTTLTVHSTADLSSFGRILSQATEDYLILGRAGNIIVADWKTLLRIKSSRAGIVKIQIGKVPSELYIMRRDICIKLLKKLDKKLSQENEKFLKHLFDDFLFHNFERIIESSGYSFFIRDAFEYYRENLNLLSYLQDPDFFNLYATLKPPHISKILITESGNVKYSVLGFGAQISGIVENSIIFRDVVIKKNARIYNSVILPSNIIEEDVVIQNALILGGKDRTVERNTVIGDNTGGNNSDYPSILKKGLTIIGQSLTIPNSSRIGAGCLVFGKADKLQRPLEVEAGMTFKAG
jgi:carbonic anhydrase/acetyltransferase-like protein (isoleucine patch superfamily)